MLLRKIGRKKANKEEVKIGSVTIKTEKEKFNIKKVRPEQWVIFAIYVIVFGVIAYFAVGSLLPKSIVPIDNNFVISASSLQIFDKLSSFYIDKEVLGSKETIDEETVRKVTSAEAFNLIFKPKTIVAEGTNAELNINLIGSGSDVYLNDKPIIPDLTNYELVADIGSEAVYANKAISEYYSKDSLISSNDAQDFVYKNFPGASVYSFSDAKSYVPVLSDYEQDWTGIGGTFRDNLKLAVYAQGDLNIRFVKQDLNSYVGKDEYTVEIKDQDGKSYYTKKYEDDGDTSKSNKAVEEQDFEIELKELSRGIYYITFTKDKFNPSSDSTLKDIRIDSNKVLIIGNSLIWSKSFNFYTEVFSAKTIGFMYWWKGYDQIVTMSGADSKKINLDEDWINKRKDVTLDKQGDYTFSVPKGYLWVYSNIISPTKSNWFDIPKQNEGNLKNQDIIIVNKNKLKIEGNNISFSDSIVLNKDTKMKLQFVEENKIYLKDIRLEVK